MQAKFPGSVSEREEKLKKSLAEEATKKNINDSKFRAVAQRMDYAGFHQMVLGANLKPTKAGEVYSISSASTSVFNSSCRTSGNSQSKNQNSQTCLAFWRNSPSRRAELLKSPESFLEELRKNPDFTVLAEVLNVVQGFEDLQEISNVLDGVLGIQEFKGSKKLLTRKEKEHLECLLLRCGKNEYNEFFT